MSVFRQGGHSPINVWHDAGAGEDPAMNIQLCMATNVGNAQLIVRALNFYRDNVQAKLDKVSPPLVPHWPAATPVPEPVATPVPKPRLLLIPDGDWSDIKEIAPDRAEVQVTCTVQECRLSHHFPTNVTGPLFCKNSWITAPVQRGPIGWIVQLPDHLETVK